MKTQKPSKTAQENKMIFRSLLSYGERNKKRIDDITYEELLKAIDQELGISISRDRLEYIMRAEDMPLWRFKEKFARFTTKKLQEENAGLRRQLGLLENINKANKVKTKLKVVPAKMEHDEHTTLILLSDVHFSKRVTKEATQGANEFNVRIAEDRLNNFFANSVFLHKKYNPDGTSVCLMLLGDMIEGYLRDSNLKENELTPAQEVVELLRIIKGGIEYILGECPKVKQIIVPCVSGNHDRTTLKVTDTNFKDSYGYILYNALANYFENNSKVEFKIVSGDFCDFNIYGKTLVAIHGYQIKGGSSLGGYGAVIGKFFQKLKTNFPQVEHLFMGDKHQLNFSPDVTVNGCVCGADNYAMNYQFRITKPTQAFLLFSKNYGEITLRTQIYLDKAYK